MSLAQYVEDLIKADDRLTHARALGIIVDEQDEWLLSLISWHIHSEGYVAGYLRLPDYYHIVYLHHMIMGVPIWQNIVVDHVNLNPIDNRRNNLRWVTHAENLRNNNHPLGQTGERGTTISRTGKYISRVVWDGTTYHLGSFDTLAEAVAAREEWLR